MYHDVILWKHEQKKMKNQPSLNPTQKKILPRWWQAASIFFSSITATEVFFEVLFRSKGKRWQAIFILELFR